MDGYAVVWSDGRAVHTGRLDVYADCLELHGRDGDRVVPLAEVVDVAIARGRGELLRGMRVLVVQLADGSSLRVASLGGPGVLHELARHPAFFRSGRMRAVPSRRPAPTRR